MTDLRGRNLNGPPSSPNGHHGFDFGNITPTREKLTPEQAPASPPPPPRSSGTADRSSTNNGPVANGVADFFSPDVFQIVLHNPATAHQLLKFSRERMCGENMEFLERADRYNTLLDELTKVISEIHHTFTTPDAPKLLNLSSSMLKQINADVKMTTSTTLPAMELMFADAQELTENILASDIYPRFVKHQMTASAAKALSGNRGKYAGLGDCFVLTNPAIADNPIVFASDGFVKVTGYSRADIIPRNCRFLQGTHTDRTAVRRLKSTVGANHESVELLLNYRKTGEPFWNLLYVTPLLDAEGRTAFFLGGQINCSTTIHSCSDILRLLSMGEDSDVVEDKYLTRPPSAKKASSGLNAFFKALRSRNNEKFSDPSEAGIESKLINRIERLNFKDQMDMFYTAYSKFLVISYESMAIRFYSAGVVDMLCLNPREDLNFVGNNIFKVLIQHTPTLPRDFKARIKTSLKGGRAVSADINLVTKKSAIQRSSERFATHWTPLKDEKAVVEYVVVTLTSGT